MGLKLLNKFNVFLAHGFFTKLTKEFHFAFMVFCYFKTCGYALVISNTFRVKTFNNLFYSSRQAYLAFFYYIVILDLNKSSIGGNQRYFICFPWLEVSVTWNTFSAGIWSITVPFRRADTLSSVRLFIILNVSFFIFCL